jgi:hypothetical protein
MSANEPRQWPAFELKLPAPILPEANTSEQCGETIDVQVKPEKGAQGGVFRLSLAEWMTIAQRQKFRCACGCGLLLGPCAIVVRKEGHPTPMRDALDAFQTFEFGCKPNLRAAAELANYADRARLARAASQAYKCPGYLNPCSLELIPEVFHVDHQNPTRWGGSDDDENKHILCPTCHAKKSSHEITLSTVGSLIRPPSSSSSYRSTSKSSPPPDADFRIKQESPSTASFKQAELAGRQALDTFDPAPPSGQDPPSDAAVPTERKETSDAAPPTEQTQAMDSRAPAEQKEASTVQSQPLDAQQPQTINSASTTMETWKKHVIDEERRAAKNLQKRASERRHHYADQHEYHKSVDWKYSREHHKRTGYAAQKAWRARKRLADLAGATAV